MGLSDFTNSIITKDQFSGTFNKFDRAVQGSGQRLDKLGGILSGGGLGMLFGGVAGIAGVTAITKMAFSLGDLGAQSLTTEASFNSLMRSVGLSTRLLDELKTAAGGTMTEMALMQQANTALAGSSGQLATEMGAALPRLLEAARAAAKLNPAYGDAAFMFQSLVGGIKRGTPLLIDNTGIVLKVGEATAKYAEELGKSADELTSQERSLAILRGTLEGADRLIAQTAGSMNSMASSSGKLKTAWMELKTAIGEGIAPTTSALQEGAAATINQITSVINSDAMTRALTMLEQYRARLAELQAMPEGKRTTLDAGEIADAEAAIKRYSAAVGGMVQAETQAEMITKAAAWAARDAAGALNDSAGASQTAGINAAALAATLQGVRNAYSIAADMAQRYAGIVGGSMSNRTFIGGVDVLSQSQYTALTQNRINMERGLQLQVAAGTKTQAEADYELARFDRNVNDHISTLRNQSTAVASVGAAYDDLKSRISGALRPTFDLSGLTGGLLGGMGGDTFDEAYKRLAAVALRPEELQIHSGDWAATFEQAGLTGLTPEQAQARARELVEAYSKGLDFSLIDREAIKDQVRQAIKAEELYNSIVDEIYAEMGKERQGLTNAGRRIGDQLANGTVAQARQRVPEVVNAWADALTPEIIARIAAQKRRGGGAYQ